MMALPKSAAEAHRLLVEAYGEAAFSERSCREWFQKFKNDEFDIEDKERSGRPKVYDDAELESLDQDSCQTQEDLALTLGVAKPVAEKKKASKGPAAKSPVKKAKPAAPKTAKPAAAKVKKAAPKKTTVSKK